MKNSNEKLFVSKKNRFFFQAVGTDRNVSQSLLEHRAELLSSLLRLFHCDIQTIYDQFSASGQYKNMSEKLYHIFETYLPILQYNGNIFQNMPISKLPKVSCYIEFTINKRITSSSMQSIH